MIDELKELADEKTSLIESERSSLQELVVKAQSKLFAQLYGDLLEVLMTEGGKLTNTNANINSTSAVDRRFKEFEGEMANLADAVVSGYNKVFAHHLTYYRKFDAKALRSMESDMRKAMMKRIGLAGTKVERNGFIDSMISDKTVARQVKQYVLSAVMNGESLSKFNTGLSTIIKGTDKVSGAIDAHFRTYVYDTYSQFDRESGNQFSVALDLNYAIYAGGLVDDSRPFCVERNGKVFTREEVRKFGTPQDKFGGYSNKKKGEFQGKNKNYIPERDMGGYNCGHTYNWVSYEIAAHIRPDLPKPSRA